MSRSAESLTRGGGDVYRNSACCQCSSWSWPEDVPSKQKLVFFTALDPDEVFFKRGARSDTEAAAAQADGSQTSDLGVGWRLPLSA